MLPLACARRDSRHRGRACVVKYREGTKVSVASSTYSPASSTVDAAAARVCCACAEDVLVVLVVLVVLRV